MNLICLLFHAHNEKVRIKWSATFQSQRRAVVVISWCGILDSISNPFAGDDNHEYTSQTVNATNERSPSNVTFISLIFFQMRGMQQWSMLMLKLAHALNIIMEMVHLYATRLKPSVWLHNTLPAPPNTKYTSCSKIATKIAYQNKWTFAYGCDCVCV